MGSFPVAAAAVRGSVHSFLRSESFVDLKTIDLRRLMLLPSPPAIRL